jgi:hypothetical protein
VHARTLSQFHATINAHLFRISQMGVSLLPTFPVELVPNRTVSTTVVSGMGPLLDATPYSFAFWQLHDVLLVRFLSN